MILKYSFYTSYSTYLALTIRGKLSKKSSIRKKEQENILFVTFWTLSFTINKK